MFASAVSLYIFLHICSSSLTILVTGNIGNLSVEADSHNLTLSWINTNDEDCVVSYVIVWEDITNGSENGCNITTNNSYVIASLEACVTFNISVRSFCQNCTVTCEPLEAADENCEVSEPAITNATTCADVPGQVQELSLKPGSHNISVTWKKPISNSYCVTQYVIYWLHTLNGSNESIVVPSTENSSVIEPLDACVKYEVSLRAENEINGSMEAVTNNTITETVVPGQVQDFSLKPGSHNISVTWKKPISNSYCVTQYVIYWLHTLNGSNESIVVPSTENSSVIEPLDACFKYEVSLRAENEINESMEAVTNSTITETVVPGQVQDLSFKTGSHNISVNWKKPISNRYCVKQYDVYWVHAQSGSKNNSTVSSEEDSFVIEHLDACVEYEVSVRAVNEEHESMDSVTFNTTTETAVPEPPKFNNISCLETEKVCLAWNLPDLSKNECTIHNITVICEAEDNPELPVRKGDTQNFTTDPFIVNVVGLSPSTNYSCVAYITIESETSNNSSAVLIATKPDVVQVVPVVPVAMIVGVLFAIIAIGLIAVVVVTYHQGTLVWPPVLFRKPKQTTVRPQPVLLKKFPEYCAQMLDTPTRLGSEYQLLATLSADISEANSCVNGQLPENRRKNRYINILPYDATRVTLDLIDGDPNSHYINASFIKGYSDEIEYIATQGPKEETCLDFWRMVFQHDIRVIVMVTNLIEQDKVKCHQYYPNWQESIAFGDMTIHCSTQTEFPIHTARTFVLMKGNKKRTLSHLHFREWPDFGVPQSTDVMIHFCQTVRHHALAAEGGLILVHCSAGVGRTGTLTAVDILLQHIAENKKVDIFGTVFKLRKQRINMVQTEGQYTYIYRCIKDAVQDPTIVNPSTVGNNQLEPIYENVGTSLNHLQYEKLPKWRNKDGEA